MHEKLPDVGLQLTPNFQGLLCEEPTIEEYLKKLNLNPEFLHYAFNKVCLCTRNKEYDHESSRSFPFVCRGGKQSLEYGLYKEAKELGVRFIFNSKINESKVDIIATGHRSEEGAAFGAVYKDNGFLKDRFLIIFDDRYSPIGWYIYATPHFKGYVKIMNCVLRPYDGVVKELLFKAIKEREILRKIVGDQKPVSYLGGRGGLKYPIQGKLNGQYYVGEAAGFQDPFRGFGMHYALESGKLAADAIIQNKDYDTLWKKAFMPAIKKDFCRRYIMSVVGDKWVEFTASWAIKGKVVDFGDFTPSGTISKVATEFFFRMELLKHKITGYW